MFQMTCPKPSIKTTVIKENSIGECSEDHDCDEICNIWSKTRSRGSLNSPKYIQYRCEEGKCECNNFIESCSQKGAICPWV